MARRNPTVTALSEELLQLSARAVCFPVCEESEGGRDDGDYRLRARTRSGWLRTAANVLLSPVSLDVGPGVLFALAEGNYKDEGSAIAAAVAIAELGARFATGLPWAAVAETLGDSFLAAHQRIAAISQAARPLCERFDTVMGPRKDLHGIGAAATAVVVGPTGRGVVAHVGDCRAYLLHGRQTIQVTTDHTLATAMTRGEVKLDTEVPAAEHIVMRVLGFDTPPQIDILPLRLEPGDGVVLVSCLARPVLPWDEMPEATAGEPARLLAALFDRLPQQGAPAAMVVARWVPGR